MEIVKNTGIRKIYIGILINLLCSLVKMVFSVTIRIMSVIEGGGMATGLQLVTSVLSVLQIAAVLTVIAGLSDLIVISAFRRTRIWCIIRILIYSVDVIAEAGLIALSNRFIDAHWLSDVKPVISLSLIIFDLVMLLWFDAIIGWNLLQGFQVVYQKCGVHGYLRQRTVSLGIQLIVVSVMMAIVVAAAGVILSVRAVTFSMDAELIITTGVAGIAVIILLICMGGLYIWKYVVEFGVVQAARKVWNVVDALSK